jgi:hypothetical protein
MYLRLDLHYLSDRNIVVQQRVISLQDKEMLLRRTGIIRDCLDKGQDLFA